MIRTQTEEPKYQEKFGTRDGLYGYPASHLGLNGQMEGCSKIGLLDRVAVNITEDRYSRKPKYRIGQVVGFYKCCWLIEWEDTRFSPNVPREEKYDHVHTNRITGIVRRFVAPVFTEENIRAMERD